MTIEQDFEAVKRSLDAFEAEVSIDEPAGDTGAHAALSRILADWKALRTALEGGRCPECGAWVRDSWWAREALQEST
jgi:hypothetical protein